MDFEEFVVSMVLPLLLVVSIVWIVCEKVFS